LPYIINKVNGPVRPIIVRGIEGHLQVLRVCVCVRAAATAAPS
jgi:hypothetical protein